MPQKLRMICSNFWEIATKNSITIECGLFVISYYLLLDIRYLALFAIRFSLFGTKPGLPKVRLAGCMRPTQRVFAARAWSRDLSVFRLMLGKFFNRKLFLSNLLALSFSNISFSQFPRMLFG